MRNILYAFKEIWLQKRSCAWCCAPQGFDVKIEATISDGFFKIEFLVLLVSALVSSWLRLLKIFTINIVYQNYYWVRLVDKVNECKSNDECMILTFLCCHVCIFCPMWNLSYIFILLNFCLFLSNLIVCKTLMKLLYCDHVCVAPNIERVRPMMTGWTWLDWWRGN